jgi:hypothetical protein
VSAERARQVIAGVRTVITITLIRETQSGMVLQESLPLLIVE